MTMEMRKTGIDVVGDVPWGTHFCLFYETTDDVLFVSMQERLRVLRGAVRVDSAPSRGTRINVWVPSASLVTSAPIAAGQVE